MIILHIEIDECKQSPNGGCNHTCTNTDGSYYCSCHDGYVLGNDTSSCIGMCDTLWVANSDCCDSDINECQTDNGGCTQTCDNTGGSYQCFCQLGYELTSDNHTCVGKEVYFILSHYHKILYHVYISSKNGMVHAYMLLSIVS